MGHLGKPFYRGGGGGFTCKRGLAPSQCGLPHKLVLNRLLHVCLPCCTYGVPLCHGHLAIAPLMSILASKFIHLFLANSWSDLCTGMDLCNKQ